MMKYGQIRSYDCDTMTGTIQPNCGGQALAFRNVDLQQEASEPHCEDYFAFETWVDDDGEETAVHLCQLS